MRWPAASAVGKVFSQVLAMVSVKLRTRLERRHTFDVGCNLFVGPVAQLLITRLFGVEFLVFDRCTDEGKEDDTAAGCKIKDAERIHVVLNWSSWVWLKGVCGSLVDEGCCAVERRDGIEGRCDVRRYVEPDLTGGCSSGKRRPFICQKR
jgi:hypothetical protein